MPVILYCPYNLFIELAQENRGWFTKPYILNYDTSVDGCQER